MLRLPNGAGPCCRTTHLKVIVQKVTGMAASRIMTPPKKKKYTPVRVPRAIQYPWPIGLCTYRPKPYFSLATRSSPHLQLLLLLPPYGYIIFPIHTTLGISISTRLPTQINRSSLDVDVGIISQDGKCFGFTTVHLQRLADVSRSNDVGRQGNQGGSNPELEYPQIITTLVAIRFASTATYQDFVQLLRQKFNLKPLPIPSNERDSVPPAASPLVHRIQAHLEYVRRSKSVPPATVRYREKGNSSHRNRRM